jgi:hypothetical protein
MTTRRELICGSIALATFAALPRAHSRSASARTPLVILDSAVEGAAQFATVAAARGAAVREMRDDIGALWMNEIEPHWRARSLPIAGLTAGGPLFCLELFARDYGMRVAHRARHTRLAGGALAHVVDGAEAELDARGLEVAGERWSTVAAALVLLEPALRSPRGAIPLLDLAQDDRKSSVYSWLLAPQPRSQH